MAKQGIHSVAQGRKDLLRIDPTDLHIKEDWNCREVNFNPKDADDLALAHSIAEVGVKQPLTAVWEDGKAFITDGHRRLLATRYAIETLKAEVKSIPVQTEDRYAGEADRVLSMLVRNNGKPLTSLEMGKVYKRLIDLGWKEKEIAAKVGRSIVWVKTLLQFNTESPEVIDMVRRGEVSLTTAVSSVREHGKDAAKTLKKAVVEAKAKGKTKATPKHLKVKKAAPPTAEAVAMSNLTQLAGFVQNASDTTITISQDDATFSWVVRAGKITGHASDLMGAIQAAADAQAEQDAFDVELDTP